MMESRSRILNDFFMFFCLDGKITIQINFMLSRGAVKPVAEEKLAVLKLGLILATRSLLAHYKSERTRFDNSVINNKRRFLLARGTPFLCV